MWKLIKESVFCLRDHHGTIRTASLTYVSILSIAPLIILLSAMAGRLDYIGLLQGLMMEWNTKYEMNIPVENIVPIIEQLQNVNFGSLGVIGTLSLFFTFWMTLQSLETNINAPWECKSARPLTMKFGLFAPFMCILFGTIILISLWLEAMRHVAAQKLDLYVIEMSSFNGTIWAGGGIATAFIVALFVFLYFCYVSLPRTKVILTYTAWVSLATSIVMVLMIGGIISLQGWMFSRYSAIYGSFAILPTIAIGLWLFWFIVLVGNAVNIQLHLKAGWNHTFAYPNKTRFEPKNHKLIPKVKD